MIEIKEYDHGITVAGHAGPAPDLVCEDITALTQCLAVALDELTDAETAFTVEKGYSLLTYKGHLSHDAQVLINAFFVGVCAISNTFPDKVRVSRLA